MSAIVQMVLSTFATVPAAPNSILTSGNPGINYPTTNTWSTSNKNASVTYSNGNLTAAGTSNTQSVIASQGMSSGKWYWETTIGAGTTFNILTGIALSTLNVSATIYTGQTLNSAFTCYALNGALYNGFSQIVSGITGTPVAFNSSGVVVGIALDLTNNIIAWYKNGVLMEYYTIPSGQTWFPAIGCGTSGSTWSMTADFGNSQLIYNPPTGFTSGVGGTGVATGNETWLPANASSSGLTFSNGNLTVVCPTVGSGKMGYAAAPAPLNTKTYWEVTCTNNAELLGIALNTCNLTKGLAGQTSAAMSLSYFINNGLFYNGISTNLGSGFDNAGTKFGFALDTTVGAMNISFYSMNILQHTFTLADGNYYPAFGFQIAIATASTANFGASAFNYTIPTGFVSLNSVL